MKKIIALFLALAVCVAHAQTFPVNNLTVSGKTTMAYPPAVTGDCQNILAYGGSGNGTTANDAALTALLAAEPAGSKCVYFPPGKFKFASAVSYTMVNQIESLMITGAGPDSTELTWPNTSGGFSISLINPFNSVHFRDLTLSTGQIGASTAVTLTQTIASYGAPANTALSDFTNVSIRGADGFQVNDYWSTGIAITKVSNINFTNLTIAGMNNGAGYSTHGTGVSIQGTAAVVPVVFNFLGSTFNGLLNGIVYGTYTQGVSVNQSNFTGGSYGIVTQGTLLDQLNVYGSQFNCGTAGILQTNNAPQSMIYGNLFIVPNSASGIVFNESQQFGIVGNTFISTTPVSNNGVVVAGTINPNGGVITGNIFTGFTGSGVFLQSTSNHVNVQSNFYSSNATNVVNSGTANTVGGGSQ